MGTQDNDASTKSPDTPSGRSVGVGKETRSPPPPPGVELSPRERKVWDYICAQLREAGMPHLTAGIAIAVVCRTFIRWVNTEMELRNFEASNGGSYFIKTPKGYDQPHQLFYAASSIKKELLTWLPESCLTLPSTVTARSKLGDEGVQDDLFADLFDHGLERVAPQNKLPV